MPASVKDSAAHFFERDGPLSMQLYAHRRSCIVGIAGKPDSCKVLDLFRDVLGDEELSMRENERDT